MKKVGVVQEAQWYCDNFCILLQEAFGKNRTLLLRRKIETSVV